MIYPRVSFYAFLLAAAGIPLYIHLPRFAAVHLGIGLGAIGTLLLAIRLIDLLQDPFLGWAIDRWPNAQSHFALLAVFGLGLGFPLLFTLESGDFVFLKLCLILVLLFSAYSLGLILLYGRSATLAHSAQPSDLLTLAAYREGGMLAGVLVAAIAPALFVGLGATGQGYQAFGWFLGSIAVLVAILTRPIWRRTPIIGQTLSYKALMASGSVSLLILALINNLPVAITSTLFLFFVEDYLQLAGMSGPLLILFFLAAGLSIPLWTKLSQRIGAKETLIIAMPLAIVSFIGAGFLAQGNLIGFAIICISSGAALGADMVLLPAMFSVALSNAGLKASAAFGLWSFAGKLGLALAAFLVLPLLQAQGFEPDQENTQSALTALTITYAFIPCILKLIAFAFLLRLPTQEKTA